MSLAEINRSQITEQSDIYFDPGIDLDTELADVQMLKPEIRPFADEILVRDRLLYSGIGASALGQDAIEDMPEDPEEDLTDFYEEERRNREYHEWVVDPNNVMRLRKQIDGAIGEATGGDPLAIGEPQLSTITNDVTAKMLGNYYGDEKAPGEGKEVPEWLQEQVQEEVNEMLAMPLEELEVRRKQHNKWIKEHNEWLATLPSPEDQRPTTPKRYAKGPKLE